MALKIYPDCDGIVGRTIWPRSTRLAAMTAVHRHWRRQARNSRNGVTRKLRNKGEQ